jgi:hypothetical protein
MCDQEHGDRWHLKVFSFLHFCHTIYVLVNLWLLTKRMNHFLILSDILTVCRLSLNLRYEHQ